MMLSTHTRKALTAASALLLLAPLTSCGDKGKLPVASANRPAIERVTPPARTDIPDGTVPCAFDATKLCLSDEQNAQLLRRFDAGESERDRMICWLRQWFGYPACPGS